MDKLLFDTSPCTTDVLQDDLFIAKNVSVAVLRLDKLHAIVSGNKLFKLHYFLQEALSAESRHIITFGGAFSNHLVATAFACRQLSLRCTGIVRGEKPPQPSPTLQQCMELSMQLEFISRNDYTKKDDPAFIASITDTANAVIIPEGGFGRQGTAGASLIMDMVDKTGYTHIATAVGTATTLAGLLTKVLPGQTVIGVPALKGMTDIRERIGQLTGNSDLIHSLQMIDTHHFGGYAKYNATLIDFMNDCWLRYRLPLDFVYTGKMLYNITDAIRNDRFAPGSRILCLHTGGLQGNRSLPVNTLLY